jgi:polysaccharide chain length determinant protein (PEP-CTERM system associated)
MRDLDNVRLKGLDDYWAIVCRRRWWVVLPCFLCWAIILGGSWLVPASYRSDALILIEQQQVPAQYVLPNVSLSLEDRVQSITQQILSRKRLQGIIDHFNLYAKNSPAALLETADPVEQMRKDIHIDFVESSSHPGTLSAFRITYEARSRELAQEVNSELTSLFIDENLTSQQQQSESTTAFLANQLEQARSHLEEQEARVRAFKAKHFGNLPSQLESNVQILNGLQSQLADNERSLDSAKQQKLYFDSLLQQYETVQVDSSGMATPAVPESIDSEILQLRTSLAEARSRYTEDFPDVVSLKHKLSEAEQLKKELAAHSATAASSSSHDADTQSDQASTKDSSNVSDPIIHIRSQLKAEDFEIKNYQRRHSELESQIEDYRSRLNLTPGTEQELAEISRGYEESKLNYNSLLEKQNQSKLATSLEQRQQGEQFRIIDPPTMPDKPLSPKHFIIGAEGFALGLAVGFTVAGFVEFSKQRVWTEKDLDGIVSERILVVIPPLELPEEKRMQSLYRWMEIGLAGLVFVGFIAGNMYAFYKG